MTRETLPRWPYFFFGGGGGGGSGLTVVGFGDNPFHMTGSCWDLLGGGFCSFAMGYSFGFVEVA